MLANKLKDSGINLSNFEKSFTVRVSKLNDLGCIKYSEKMIKFAEKGAKNFLTDHRNITSLLRTVSFNLQKVVNIVKDKNEQELEFYIR